MEISRLDHSSSFCVSLKHDGKLKDRDRVIIQVAILYTDAYGQRKIRIHNLALYASTSPAAVFKSADVDSCLALLTKIGNGIF